MEKAKFSAEFVSPFKICILALIEILHEINGESDTAFLVLEFLVHITQGAGATRIPEPSFSELLAHLKKWNVPITVRDDGGSVSDWLREKMISLKSVMELDLFFERLLRFLRAPDTVQGEIVIFDSLSPIGIYIRRARLEARKMDFSQVSDLWSAFQSYLGELASPVGPADRWSLLSETEDLRDIRFYKSIDMRSTPFCAAVMPKWNSQKYLHKQLEYIEKHSGKPIPASVQKAFEQILFHLPQEPRIHYAMFLQALQTKNFEIAMESLHKYFDHNDAVDKDNKAAYQYSLWNLALLYAEFGHVELAKEALEKSQEKAREQQDDICLAVATSWLQTITRKRKFEMKEFDMLKTEPRPHLQLKSMLYLSSAKASLESGSSPSVVLDALLRSRLLNTKDSVDAGKTFASESGAWQMYGNNTFAMLKAQLQQVYAPEEGCGDCILTEIENRVEPLVGVGGTGGVSSISQDMNKTLSKIRAKRYLGLGRINEAEEVLRQFDSTTVDDTLTCLRLSLKADSGEASMAYVELMEKVSDYEETGDVMKLMPFLLEAVKVKIEHDPISALSLVLTCLSLSAQRHIQQPYLMSLVYLSEVFIHLGEAQRAVRMIQTNLSVLLLSDDWVVAQAWLVYAKALLATASSDADAAQGRVEGDELRFYHKVLQCLQRSASAGRRVEALKIVRESVHLQAVVFDVLGEEQERNRASVEFRDLDTQMRSNWRRVRA